MKSLMFVPCRQKMLEKIPALDADAYIIDLEDSVNESEKQQALELACAFLMEPRKETCFVRLAGNHLEEELARLSPLSFAGYMIPKFECAEDYRAYEAYFRKKEVIALVETPLGLVNLRETASCGFVSMLAFGAEDYTAAAGMKNCAETLFYARSRLVTYGKAFRKPVFDTPSFVLDDADALEREIRLAVDMGFDGKLAIHPGQVTMINRLFQCSEPEYMRQIVAQYEAAGEAVLRIGDKVYEKMHIAHMKRILAEHEKA